MKVPMLTDESGKPSFTFTMVVLSFLACFAWLVFWLVGTALEIPVPAFDATEATVFLSPVFALYFGRRGQKLKTTKGETENG